MTKPSQFTQTSFNYQDRFEDKKVGADLDRDLKMIFTSHGTLNGTAVKAPTFGGTFAVQSGSLSVTGSKTGIPTGLSTVQQAVASIDNGATAHNFWVSCNPSTATTGAIDVYVWMPTNSTTNTPIAATSAVTVRWWATGSATTTT